ncbi:type II toxin-antitoxin system RelE/ParE family toxin [Methylohalobius crimeensis]|uniref:type II toxin-antitoxin system RelE/ParE family toxin n=1 Tax=Methylohalobius crimeensis TaxID=244365 RepID=UPI002AA2B177|nr:type II toxin-antitoxin system RelE/ParE family toxin [Methylohalobius crimeensis]
MCDSVSRPCAGNRVLTVSKAARRKLALLNRIASVEELRIPPGNRLEKLSGDREGQWSIRINNQWRVCFEWRDAMPGMSRLWITIERLYEHSCRRSGADGLFRCSGSILGEVAARPSRRNSLGGIPETDGHQPVPAGQGNRGASAPHR